MRRAKAFSPTIILSYAVLLLGAFFVIYPFFYMVNNSVKTGQEIMHSPTALPEKIVFTGYTGVFDELDVMLLFKNSVFLAGSITVLNTIFSALAAYAFAKIPFPGRDKIFGFMLLTMMIPGVLFLIPTYVLMYRIGWVGHFEALIVPSIVSVFNIFLIRQFMSGIPDELVEAARIDGAGEMVIFTRIILPLARPALATVAILTFMGSWNDFFGPLLYLNRPEQWTLQLGLLQFRGTVPGENAQQIWALTTIITVPIVVVYFFIQEQFVKAFANVSLSK
ncbi:MAG: permease [Chloroflexota bacterium]|nr:carbohydrate ABC transporter permease [Chloroflexota bacterium]NOG61867.1 carbohydrate ABC transporter permease [Chloroflexota bacterium]GIK62544.1 MAG: permease [Chloroflexota bacterium]